MSRLLLLLLLSLLPNPRIQIRAGEPIKLDGKIDEGEWKDAFSTKRPLPHERAMTIRFKRTGPCWPFSECQSLLSRGWMAPTHPPPDDVMLMHLK